MIPERQSSGRFLVKASVVGLFSLFLISGIAPGSAHADGGISNGGISGSVRDEMGLPLAGVNVVAVRQDTPPVIRNASTDEMGSYFLGDMPLGVYLLGFSRYGFKTIPTEGGDGTGSPTGSQVRAIVESGTSSTVAGVTLQTEAVTGQGNLDLRLIDATSGEPITHASVSTAGGAINGSPTGLYTFSLPVRFDENNEVLPTQVFVSADGFQSQTLSIPLLPGTTARQEVRQLVPGLVSFEGLVRLPGDTPSERYSEISLTVRDIDSAISQGTVSGNGVFEVSVPATNEGRNRQYDLIFRLRGFEDRVLTGVVPPFTGTRTLDDVELVPAAEEPGGDPGE